MFKLKSLVIAVGLVVASVAQADMKISVMHTRISSRFGTLALGDAIDHQLAELAKHAGYAVEDTAFPLEELACREIDCLPAIAERHGLQALAFAEIGFDKIMNADIVKVSVYRVDASVRNELERCPDCDEKKATKLVDAVATRLLRSEPGSATPLDHMALLPPENGSNGEPPPNHRKAFLALGAISAVGAVGSIVALAVEASRNGACTETSPLIHTCAQKRDTTGPVIGSVIGAVVFAALTPTFFVLAHREAKKTAVTAAYVLPNFDQNSAGVVAGGRF
jgi:hypothetical protein